MLPISLGQIINFVNFDRNVKLRCT